MSIIDLFDFSGGYSKDYPSELLQPNELIEGYNCHWVGSIRKRLGYSRYANFTDKAVYGAIETELSGSSVNIVAKTDGSNVKFYTGTTGTYTVVPGGIAWTDATRVRFAELAGYIVAVNGIDKPIYITYSSGWTSGLVETLDTRTRANENWWAGQWTDATTLFTDDTSDAQDVGTADFQIASTTNNDGFYIACDYSFNKIVLTTGSQMTGSPAAEYAYWDGSTWAAITPGTVPTWTAAEGTRTIEFDIPLAADGTLAWKPYEVSNETDGITNRYIFRIRFTTAPGEANTCASIAIYHTQYLTEIMQDERPHLVYTHNSQLYLCAGNAINISLYNQVRFEEEYAEYFEEGGDSVTGLCSFNDNLVVAKDDTIFTYNVGNFTDPVRSRPLTAVGCISPECIINLGGIVAFAANDGIYVFTGTEAVKVSKRIDGDYSVGTSPCAFLHDGEAWFAMNSYVFIFDIDTFRRDEIGNGLVSFFDFNNPGFYQMFSQKGAGAAFFAIYNAGFQITRLDYGATDNLAGTATAITKKMQTKYISPGSPQKKYRWGRLKPKLREQAATYDETLTLYTKDGDVSEDVTIPVSAGTGFYSEDISVPYTIDGKGISIKMEDSSSYTTEITGFSFNTDDRRF
jgi:hypothetical protein